VTTTPQNKGMKLTKLSAAPERGRRAWLPLRCRLMPAPTSLDAGTASQLIPGVRRTSCGAEQSGWAAAGQSALLLGATSRSMGLMRILRER
jgi:hypothetical protein